MSRTEPIGTPVTVSVENIGGISTAEVSLPPGVTVLSGENATNRTSFLRAIMAALGSRRASLKADADAGRVELELGDSTYERRLNRTNGTVEFGGDPYLDDPELADLFAFLLEENEARQAVTRSGADLRSVIMQPIDTTAIKAEITQTEAAKRQLDEQLAELDTLEDRLPELATEKTQIDGDIESKEEELHTVEAEIEAAEADIQETRNVKDELESKLSEVQETRSDFETTKSRLETERESIAALEEERESLEQTIEDLPESVGSERTKIESELSELRSTQSRLETEVSELQNLIQFNQDLLSGEDRLVADLDDDSSGDVTAQLVDDGTLTCWTCGSEVERGEVEGAVSQLQDIRADKLEKIQALEDQIDELNEEKRTLEERAREREGIEQQLESVERELAGRRSTVETLEERRDELADEIEALESAVDSLEMGEDHTELLDLHQEESRLELEIERLREKRSNVESEIEELEARIEKRDELEAEREAVAEELTELRTRIERVEQEAVEEFNERIEDVLDILGSENIERIWIERVEAAGAGRGESSASFEMHVVRSDETGTAYEDTIDHLSESEREVTGLVFALAGYLVHEVYDVVPFMVLDSLEALDADRIARLVEYFEEEAPYLVIALLEEDAEALDADYTRVTAID